MDTYPLHGVNTIRLLLLDRWIMWLFFHLPKMKQRNDFKLKISTLFMFGLLYVLLIECTLLPYLCVHGKSLPLNRDAKSNKNYPKKISQESGSTFYQVNGSAQSNKISSKKQRFQRSFHSSSLPDITTRLDHDSGACKIKFLSNV